MELETLYGAYKNRIYSLCLRLAGSRAAADDLFGETWARVAAKHGNLAPGKDPANWLYAVCINVYRKSSKRDARLPAATWPTQEEHDEALAAIPADDNPADEAIGAQDVFALRRELGALDDKYRVPLVLFYFRDLSYKDVAAALGLPMSTVKFRIHRAKELLRGRLEGEI